MTQLGWLGRKPSAQTNKQEKCLTALWTVFQKVNEKVNLGRPNALRTWHRYLKGQIFEKSVQNLILAAQAFGFRSDKYLTKKVRVVSLIQGMPTGPYLCLYQWSAQEFGLEIHSGEFNLKIKKQRYCPSCMWHSYLTWYMSPSNIIKLSQTVWELWPAQNFGFRGDKYIK